MKCQYCNRSISDEDYCKGCGAPVLVVTPTPPPNPLRDIPDATWDKIKDSLEVYSKRMDYELEEGEYLDVTRSEARQAAESLRKKIYGV